MQRHWLPEPTYPDIVRTDAQQAGPDQSRNPDRGELVVVCPETYSHIVQQPYTGHHKKIYTLDTSTFFHISASPPTTTAAYRHSSHHNTFPWHHTDLRIRPTHTHLHSDKQLPAVRHQPDTGAPHSDRQPPSPPAHNNSEKAPAPIAHNNTPLSSTHFAPGTHHHAFTRNLLTLLLHLLPQQHLFTTILIFRTSICASSCNHMFSGYLPYSSLPPPNSSYLPMALTISPLPTEPATLYPGPQAIAPIQLTHTHHKDQHAKPSNTALATVLYTSTPVNLTHLELTSFGSTLHPSVCRVLHNSHGKPRPNIFFWDKICLRYVVPFLHKASFLSASNNTTWLCAFLNEHHICCSSAALLHCQVNVLCLGRYLGRQHLAVHHYPTANKVYCILTTKPLTVCNGFSAGKNFWRYYNYGGNHSSAKSNPSKLQKVPIKDNGHGNTILVDYYYLYLSIPNLHFTPLGITNKANPWKNSFLRFLTHRWDLQISVPETPFSSWTMASSHADTQVLPPVNPLAAASALLIGTSWPRSAFKWHKTGGATNLPQIPPSEYNMVAQAHLDPLDCGVFEDGEHIAPVCTRVCIPPAIPIQVGNLFTANGIATIHLTSATITMSLQQDVFGLDNPCQERILSQDKLDFLTYTKEHLLVGRQLSAPRLLGLLGDAFQHYPWGLYHILVFCDIIHSSISAAYHLANFAASSCASSSLDKSGTDGTLPIILWFPSSALPVTTPLPSCSGQRLPPGRFLATMSSSFWPHSAKNPPLAALWTRLKARPTPLPTLCHDHMNYHCYLTPCAPVSFPPFTDMLLAKDSLFPLIHHTVTTKVLSHLMALYTSHLLSAHSLLCKTICTNTALKYLQVTITFLAHFNHNASHDACCPSSSSRALCPGVSAAVKAAKGFKSFPNWCRPFTIPMLLHFHQQHATAHTNTLPVALANWLTVSLAAGFQKSEWCQIHANQLLSTHRLSLANNPIAITAANVTLHDAKGAVVSHTNALTALHSIIWNAAALPPDCW
eukprot:jgi/Psemu1/27152/gm1.27152_g